jgi:2-dehydropantoate 2-reductase
MRVAVMAAGAVGGYFGGRMAAAGHDVALIARGAHRDAIRRAGTSGITASTRQPLGVIRDDEDVRAFFFKPMHETIAVGRAAGVEFAPDLPAELERSVAAFPSMMKASMANDLDVGNRLELDWLAGKPSRSPLRGTRLRKNPELL